MRRLLLVSLLVGCAEAVPRAEVPEAGVEVVERGPGLGVERVQAVTGLHDLRQRGLQIAGALECRAWELVRAAAAPEPVGDP